MVKVMRILAAFFLATQSGIAGNGNCLQPPERLEGILGVKGVPVAHIKIIIRVPLQNQPDSKGVTLSSLSMGEA